MLVLPRLFQLYDRENEKDKKITSDELRRLIDLCNMCGLCTCFTVRADIREAKDAFIARDGLKPEIRVLEDVQRVGKICGAYPRLTNLLSEIKPIANLAKQLTGIHPGESSQSYRPRASMRGQGSGIFTGSVKPRAPKLLTLQDAPLGTCFPR